ncbi:tetratricopeptide repeat protein [Streptomyces sp. NPDC060085]|uniref:tetratricopeptide repeat protein n=1 Tax=Streptomyces sp. NPDC060085 TaxID=3347054 RepID=UPI00364F0327
MLTGPERRASGTWGHGTPIFSARDNDGPLAPIREGHALPESVAGRNAEALAMEERVVADCVRVLGNDHPNTLAVRGNLADS